MCFVSLSSSRRQSHFTDLNNAQRVEMGPKIAREVVCKTKLSENVLETCTDHSPARRGKYAKGCKMGTIMANL